jgi:hypothetical protein
MRLVGRFLGQTYDARGYIPRCPWADILVSRWLSNAKRSPTFVDFYLPALQFPTRNNSAPMNTGNLRRISRRPEREIARTSPYGRGESSLLWATTPAS